MMDENGRNEESMNRDVTQERGSEEKKSEYINAGSSGTNTANSFAESAGSGYSGYRSDRSYGYSREARPHYTSYSGTGSTQGGARSSAGSYGRTVDGSVREPKEQKVKSGKAGIFFKRAVAAVLIGVLLGGSAAGAFYGVYRLTGMDEAVSTIAKASDTAAKVTKTQTTVTTAASSEDKTADAKDASFATAQAAGQDVTGVVEVALPSVVAITNSATITGQTWWGETIQQKGEYAGSGIIVGKNDEELLIVTNQHVIDDATEISIKFVDDSIAQANLKGEDADADVAVVAVPLGDLSNDTLDAIKIAVLGDSDELKVGEQVVAIGNAMGYGITTTTGIISALDAKMNVIDHELLQTDAAINPGNSGGALLNMKGEVIGINEAKAGRLLSSGMIVEGMGYAIPISTVSELIDEMMNKDTKVRAAEGKQSYLGIGGVDVTEDVSEKYNIPEGIYVAQVDPGSAADEAGIAVGDVITHFDGEKVRSMEELKEVMGYYEAGTTVNVTIKKDTEGGYEDKELEVQLGRKPAGVS